VRCRLKNYYSQNTLPECSSAFTVCASQNASPSSGTGTNLKVGAPVQRESEGAPFAPEKFCVGRAPPLFGSKSTISRFGERFRDGQYSLVSLLLAVLLLTVPRAQQFVKVGARAPLPMESAPLSPSIRQL